MSGDHAVADHYTHGALLGAISAGVEALGKTPETVSIDDLAPIDEFHIGGRRASEDFLGQLALDADTDVLDVGCGLGGASRLSAQRFGCRVTGIDLTTEFVETGQVLCSWLGLDDRITLHQGSALDMPFPDAGFQAAYMMHVGMNIADKAGLFAEVFRVLGPGGVFGVYDVMRTGDGDLTFPVPWAEAPETSALATPESYRSALEAAGFAVSAERNRRDFALEFFAELSAKAAVADGPPPLGLHVLMGATRAEKVKNMVENISAGRIAPVELIARK
jgi:ubiquinone/menaquinone biosynthesis C-methylase UbiE